MQHDSIRKNRRKLGELQSMRSTVLNKKVHYSKESRFWEFLTPFNLQKYGLTCSHTILNLTTNLKYSHVLSEVESLKSVYISNINIREKTV